MKIEEQAIPGLYLIELEPHSDERGSFARTFCRSTFARHGLQECVEQCSVSTNRHRGTLRGMHFQRSPHEETKLVRCSRGAIWDVVVDLRPGSTSFGAWFGAELSRDNMRSLYVPKGLAHGFITLSDDSDVVYQMDAPYVASAAAGVRWDDAEIGIDWPLEPVHLSPKDSSLPALNELEST